VTEPSQPTINLDGLEAVVFDTNGVLTDTASVHAATWKRLFDEYLGRRARLSPTARSSTPTTSAISTGDPATTASLASPPPRSIELPWGWS
jgi:beta-phosphoglucomutase-like phosphatase (HAD superfamily)